MPWPVVRTDHGRGQRYGGLGFESKVWVASNYSFVNLFSWTQDKIAIPLLPDRHYCNWRNQMLAETSGSLIPDVPRKPWPPSPLITPLFWPLVTDHSHGQDWLIHQPWSPPTLSPPLLSLASVNAQIWLFILRHSYHTNLVSDAGFLGIYEICHYIILQMLKWNMEIKVELHSAGHFHRISFTIF